MASMLDASLLRRLRILLQVAERDRLGTDGSAPLGGSRDNPDLACDLELLMAEGLIVPRIEPVRASSSSRGSLRMRPATKVEAGFALSEAGALCVRRLCDAAQCPPAGNGETPHWDAALGEWTLFGTETRHIRADAAELRKVLDAAADADWENPTANPFIVELGLEKGERHLRQVLDRLNHLQDMVHFHSCDKGRKFYWRRVQSRRSAGANTRRIR